MTEKTFVVFHAKARQVLTIRGKTLKEALEKEALNPDVWHLFEEPEAPPEVNFGNNKETPRDESN